MKKLLLSTIVASALILPASIYAAPNTENTPPPAQTAPTDAGPHHKKGKKGPHAGGRMQNHQNMIKERLMKMEKDLDLRPDQKPIWSKYVAAVMEMMTPMKRLEDAPKRDEMLPGERIADNIIEQKPKADRLKSIAQELYKTFDDGQKQYLKKMNAEHMKMKPHHPSAKDKPVPKDAPTPAAPEHPKP